MGRSEGLFYLIYKGDMKGNLSAYGMYFIVMKASLTVSIKDNNYSDNYVIRCVKYDVQRRGIKGFTHH
jgi:hypothetical protein